MDSFLLRFLFLLKPKSEKKIDNVEQILFPQKLKSNWPISSITESVDVYSIPQMKLVNFFVANLLNNC